MTTTENGCARTGVRKMLPLLDKLFFDWVANNFYVGMTLFKDDVILDDILSRNHAAPLCQSKMKGDVRPSDLEKLGVRLHPQDTIGKVFSVGKMNPVAARAVGMKVQKGSCILQGMWFELNWRNFAKPACEMAANAAGQHKCQDSPQAVGALLSYKDKMCARYKRMTMIEAIEKGTCYVDGNPHWGEQDQLLLDKFGEEVLEPFEDDKKS